MNQPQDPEAAETAHPTDSPTTVAGMACSRFLGEQDINAIVRGEVAIRPGDTFTAESMQPTGGVSAYAYQPGCRQGQGEWNNFRFLYGGLRTTAIATAISFANSQMSDPSDSPNSNHQPNHHPTP